MRTKLANKFKYFKEKRMTALVLLFLLLMNVAIIILGCFVLKILPENRGLSISDALWESLRLMLDPGGFLGSKLSAITTIVTSIIVLLGMVTFTGGIIGYVTNIITTKIDDSKKGIGEISIDEYTLILNWNKRVLAIILDRYADKRRDNKNEYIVILADVDKIELEREIQSALKYYKSTHVEINKDAPRVIVRSGDPTKPGELDKIHYMNADCIFIMQPEGSSDPDYAALKTFYSLAEQNYSLWDICKKDYADIEILYNVDVIVETSDAATCKAIKCTEIKPWFKGYYADALNMEFTIGKILAQVTIMPEMGSVYKEIVSLSGAVITDVLCDKNDKMSFEDRLTKYAYAIPVAEKIDEDGEKSVVFVTSESTGDVNHPYTELEKADVRVEDKQLKLNANLGKFDTHTIIICGINKKLKYILNAIRSNNEMYPSRKCKVKLVVDKNLSDLAKKFCEEYADIVFKEALVIDRYFDTDEVVELIDKDFHSMLVLSNAVEDECQKDKNVFEFWLGLTSKMNIDEDLTKKLSGKVILEIADSDNASLVQSGSEKHLVICNEIASLFMAQMAEGETVYDNLMDMLCTKKDEDYAQQNTWDQNDFDLMSIKVSDLFGKEGTVEFLGKQDFIYNVYKATNQKIIPVGCIISGMAYFFTNGKKADPEMVGTLKPSITDGILISGLDGDVYMEYLEDEEQEALASPEKYLKTDSFSLDDEDYIIACVRE